MGNSRVRAFTLFAKTHTHPVSGVTGPLLDKEAKCICLPVASLIIISVVIGVFEARNKAGVSPSSGFSRGGGSGYKL